MARKKGELPALTKLNARVLGLKSIKEDLVLKNGLSVAIGDDIQTRLKSKSDQITIQQAQLDQSRIELKALTAEAAEFSRKALSGVKNDFGENAVEVTKAGGVRTSDRAKPVSKEAKALKAQKAANKAANKA